MNHLRINLLLGLLMVTFSFCTGACQRNGTNNASTLNKADSSSQKNKSPIYTAATDTISAAADSAHPTKMSFLIVLASSADNAKLIVPNLKYNKAGWVSLEWDDNSLGAMKAVDLLKNMFYTDGCGNQIPYAAALAVVGRSQYNNEETGAMPDRYTSYTQMKSLISSGWDIENHSYYHDPTGNYNYGTDWARNISEMDQLILQRINYKMNGAVVPTNYSGFATAAKNFGYLFSTSQGTFDNLAPGMGDYKSVEPFSAAPAGFSSFKRIFYDNWSQMETDVTKAISDISSQSDAYFRFASHTVDTDVLARILSNFKARTNDKVLFLPTREIMEYRIMSQLPVNYTTQSNTLTVTIDISSIPDRFRWRDLSFVVSPESKITDVKILSGIDKISFNPATGLVNIFKQVNNWK